MQSFSNEQIRQARQADLKQYLELTQGWTFKREKKNWRCNQHDSLYVMGNAYVWYSRGDSKGNTLNFLVKHFGFTFVNAVKELNGSRYQAAQPIIMTNGPKGAVKFDKAPDAKRVIAYLTKTRKLAFDIVIKPLLERHLLSQDTNGNAVFKWINDGELIGAELQGTCSDVRFKGVLGGSLTGHGFTVMVSPKPIKVAFFESAIDLLSCWQLYREDLAQYALVSMAGLKEVTVINTIDRLGIAPENALIACDNDQAGKNFTALMKDKFGIRAKLPVCHKDWNDQLQGSASP